MSVIDDRVQRLADALVGEIGPHEDDVDAYRAGLARQIQVSIDDFLLVYGDVSGPRDALEATYGRRTT